MNETAWLIEFPADSTVPYTRWWNGHDPCIAGMTTDSLEAVRFARSADAQLVIDRVLMGIGTPTEHSWG